MWISCFREDPSHQLQFSKMEWLLSPTGINLIAFYFFFCLFYFKLPFPGDIIAIYANNNLAVTQLGWNIKYGLTEMMQTAWEWELKIKEAEEKVKSN